MLTLGWQCENDSGPEEIRGKFPNKINTRRHGIELYE